MALAKSYLNSGEVTGGNDITFSVTISGSNKVLVVGVAQSGDAALVSGVTFDGVALTKIVDAYSGATGERSSLWYLVNPTSTTANVVVDIPNGTSASAGAVLFTDAHVNSPIGATNTFSVDQQTGDPSVSVTTLYSNSICIDCLAMDTGGTQTVTADAGQTQEWTQDDGSARWWGKGSTEAKSTPGNVTMAYDSSGTINRIAYCIAEIREISLAEQEGYRFRNDDGSESAATFIEAQDTPATQEANVNTRLRVIVNGTGDLSSKQFQLEVRRKGSSGPYQKVL